MEPQGLDPTKYHILTPKQKKLMIVAGALFTLLILPLFILFYYNLAVNRPSQTDREVTLVVNKGENVTDVGRKLSDAKAINSEFLFVVYMSVNRLDAKIQAGVYTIKAGTSVKELGQQLQFGKNDLRVTFLEGWRVEQFAEAASKTFTEVGRVTFTKKAKASEGYLFPDTYIFNRESQEEDIINFLRANFEEKTADLLTEANLTRIGVTREQAVILASIVEREVRNADDRPIVAGILLKRFVEGDRVDADATVQYAVASEEACSATMMAEDACNYNLAEDFQWWPRELTLADLQMASPYNTRKISGLPPAPICNFGLASLEAVINNKQTEYYFYLTDSEGVTHYGKTLLEHNANIAKYL